MVFRLNFFLALVIALTGFFSIQSDASSNDLPRFYYIADKANNLTNIPTDYILNKIQNIAKRIPKEYSSLHANHPSRLAPIVTVPLNVVKTSIELAKASCDLLLKEGPKVILPLTLRLGGIGVMAAASTAHSIISFTLKNTYFWTIIAPIHLLLNLADTKNWSKARGKTFVFSLKKIPITALEARIMASLAAIMHALDSFAFSMHDAEPGEEIEISKDFFKRKLLRLRTSEELTDDRDGSTLYQENLVEDFLPDLLQQIRHAAGVSEADAKVIWEAIFDEMTTTNSFAHHRFIAKKTENRWTLVQGEL